MESGESLKATVYHYLKENIISTKFKPGDPILEQKIADTLSVSRTPVREAIKQLDAEGFVINYPSEGTIVAAISIDDVKEISEIRQVLETWALKRGMTNITDQDLEDCERRFQMAASSNKCEDHQSADRALHSLIVDASQSKWAMNIFNTMKNQLEWFRNSSIEITDKTASRNEHIEVIAAIRSRDLPTAVEALDYHLSQVKKRFMEINCK